MYQAFFKPLLDFIVALLLTIVLLPLFLFVSLILVVIHGASPIFAQTRIGQHAKEFTIYKFKTIKENGASTSFLKLLRKTKIDELPQLFNILKGDMSFVGPRPDIPGYYDLLQGEDRKILALKPGITGRASLKYANEEALLAQQENPLQYNDEVIFPDKVKINHLYLQHISFQEDIKIIAKTVFLLTRN